MTLESIVNKYRNDLNKTDLHIWKYIYNHKEECSNISIYELAKRCNVSRTTILRFTQKLNISGFSEFKVLLKMSVKEAPNPLSTEDSAALIMDSYVQVVEDMKKKNWDKINKMIEKSNIIYGYASGVMQKNVLSEMRRMFNNSGEYIIDIGNVGEVGHFIKRINQDSLVILISLSGENDGIIEFARELKIKEVPIIAITRFSDNSLASLADENVYVHLPKFVSEINSSAESVSSVGFFIAIETMFVNYQLYKQKKLLNK